MHIHILECVQLVKPQKIERALEGQIPCDCDNSNKYQHITEKKYILY